MDKAGPCPHATGPGCPHLGLPLWELEGQTSLGQQTKDQGGQEDIALTHGWPPELKEESQSLTGRDPVSLSLLFDSVLLSLSCFRVSRLLCSFCLSGGSSPTPGAHLAPHIR